VSVQLIKLAVGVEDVDHLIALQTERLQRLGVLVHVTRNTPKCAEELLAGGSIYWVIKKFIRVRQRLVGIERDRDSDGRPLCTLSLDPELVLTDLKEFRAFQGWRYLKSEDAPPDLNRKDKSAKDETSLPGQMAAELRGMGLL